MKLSRSCLFHHFHNTLLKLHCTDTTRSAFTVAMVISMVYTCAFGHWCYLTKHFNHVSHCGASYRVGAGALHTHTQHLAYFFPEFVVQCRINYIIHFFMFQCRGNPFHQIIFTILWINGGSPSYQLQNHHSKTVYVTFLIHPQSVRVFCTSIK